MIGSLEKNLVGRQGKGQLDGELLPPQNKGDCLGPADAGDSGQEEDGADVAA